ncbi:MAG: creatininase family protein [Candidatus Neomarinimicrobiota bacterium]
MWITLSIRSLITLVLITLVLNPAVGWGSKAVGDGISVRYEELTAIEFQTALEKADYTCIIPMGILEKHGPHLPLGTDMLDVREMAMRAAKREYTLIFPEYYFGQIYEAKHQPGTIAYSHELIWNMLQETCGELARNGVKKIILVNGHGGNNSFLSYFLQVQLEEPRDYAVYLFTPSDDPVTLEKVAERRKTEMDMHAGELETSRMLAHRPDLVETEKANTQSGEDQARLNDLQDATTGIWWYARFPNHYAGDGSPAEPKLGELLIEAKVDQLVKLIKHVKQDTRVLKLQERFFEEAKNPLKTRQ